MRVRNISDFTIVINHKFLEPNGVMLIPDDYDIGEFVSSDRIRVEGLKISERIKE